MQPCFYRIDGFVPSQIDRFTSNYGFSATLDSKYAKKAYELELNKKLYQNLTEAATSTIKNVGLSKSIEKPYQFVQNNKGKLTLLLQYCQVPGDACDLAVSWEDINLIKDSKELPLRYIPHNVDSHQQAYALLSIWLNWAGIVEAHMEK